MKGKRIIIADVAIMFSIALFMIQCGRGAQSVQGTEPAPAMTDLNNLEPLKQVFQRDRGTVRLVALLSPV